ncbi:MAG: UDP-N-acetylmuramoyl-L-alanine--D-glutamate ligase [Bacteroidales bacterium]|nr:UDP-N-acetylmuramoyl-L-alanine--D-glutamate ligase [Bacteroidales bacterium]
MNIIHKQLENKKIIILGFGKEGRSSYKFIRSYQPNLPLVVADQNENLFIEKFSDDPHLTFVLGEKYDENLNDYDLILKTPGVSLTKIDYFIPPGKIVSQTSYFLQFYSNQVIGITGTKGKSTTASLIYHILKEAGRDVILAGNIGVPFFNILDEIKPETVIVAELSAHQLEYVDASPHTAILLNMYQEHLDHFNTYNDYQLAKLNITNRQNKKDILIYNMDDLVIGKLIQAHNFDRVFWPFRKDIMLETGAYSHGSHVFLMKSREKIDDFELSTLNNLPGTHNYFNVMAAIIASYLQDIDLQYIANSLQTFQGLDHRIEYVGMFHGIRFYNDSISTIPETTIAAINTLRKVDTLILGGFDRGINYQELIDYLSVSDVNNIAFTGPAGQRIFEEWQKSDKELPKNHIIEDNYHKIIEFAFDNTQINKICLLSPAAASYDQFKNFEERGVVYKNIIQERNK